MRIRLKQLLALAALCVAWAPAARATTLPIAAGGLAESYGCLAADQVFCQLFSNFSLEPPLPIKPVSGSLSFAPTLGTATTVDITLTDLDFVMEGLSGSVERIEFSDVTLTLNAPMGVTTGPGIGTDLHVDGSVATATISGDYVLLDGSNAVVVPLDGFSDASVSIDNFACAVSFAGLGTCGFDLGLSDPFELDVDGTSHAVVQTYNLNIVPEPGTALLLGGGLALLASRAKRTR